MKTFIQTLFFFLLVTQISFAQLLTEISSDTIKLPQKDIWPPKLKMTPHDTKLTKSSLHPSFYDRKDEWPTIIKEFWGPGESLDGKLATFDLYQDYARAYNPTFVWNSINWDSLASVLRSRINDSTSRGEFSRILNDLAFGMKDGHSYAMDNVMGTTPLNPGTPILTNGMIYVSNFGAGLTPLEDSSLLVYKVVPNHPLGLAPGDIILGYQGILWHQLVRELLQGGVPHSLWIGGAPSAFNRTLLWAAGESWHLFDTIDVVKYSTGQTVHLALDTMVTLSVESNYVNNEQLPVPGVPMPEFNWDAGAVTYGVIDGTNIGYIYVYHHNYYEVSSEFDQAVMSLMGTDGLIIDIRFDWGGSYGLNSGISRLLNHPTSTMDVMERCSPSDLFSICPSFQSWFKGEIPADIGTYYDRPIAVLLGPNCISYGDISAWQFSYVPNARMFGRSPEALYSGYGVRDQPARSGYNMLCTNITLVDHYNPSNIRWGQEYPLFEEVWLTPEGVSNGEDDVVKRAVEWINNLVFAHNIKTEKLYYTAEGDSINISTVIENPNSHQISARAYLNSVEGELFDSVDLVHQLLNLEGEQWNASFNLPSAEDFYDISVMSFDITTGDQFATPNATRFTTAGPVVLDSISSRISFNRYLVKTFLRNESTNTTITNASVKLICDDPWVLSISPDVVNVPNISPGSVVSNSVSPGISCIDSLFPGYFNFKVEIMSDGWTYWTDSTQIIVGVEDELNELPTEYLLSQNYPNPLNPTTIIKYSIPKSSQVSLKIFNALGQEIETLVNEEKPVGTYELNWNAANLPSGVYFYRLQAGSFVQTRKMILLK